MSYYTDSSKISLDELQKRIEETDLVPSRNCILDNINEKFKILKTNNIFTLDDLRKELKNTKNMSLLSKKTGIDSQYLTLLRREIESYFPKAFPLNTFNWLQKDELLKLENEGYKNASLLFEALSSTKKKEEIIKKLKVDTPFIDSIYSLINLTRIQWVNPTAARLLVSAGYNSPEKVSRANAEELCERLDRVNKENRYFKGKIGLRDIKRLIKAASYVS